MKLPRATWARSAGVLAALCAAVALFIWRGPDWNLVADAFRYVAWGWVIVAILLNLLSVVSRAGAWHQVIEQAMPPPRPRFRSVFSAFGVGLFANAVLPAASVSSRVWPSSRGTSRSSVAAMPGRLWSGRCSPTASSTSSRWCS